MKKLFKLAMLGSFLMVATIFVGCQNDVDKKLRIEGFSYTLTSIEHEDSSAPHPVGPIHGGDLPIDPDFDNSNVLIDSEIEFGKSTVRWTIGPEITRTGTYTVNQSDETIVLTIDNETYSFKYIDNAKYLVGELAELGDEYPESSSLYRVTYTVESQQ